MHNNLVDSPPTKTVIVKEDSAATSNYWRVEDAHYEKNIEKAPHCDVIISNTASITPSVQGQLPLSNKLSKTAKNAVVLPELKSSLLISLGQLCDNNCQVILDKQQLKVIKEQKIILQGIRNTIDGLWDIPIKSNYVMPSGHPGLCTPINNKLSQPYQSTIKKKVTSNKQKLNVTLRKK